MWLHVDYHDPIFPTAQDIKLLVLVVNPSSLDKPSLRIEYRGSIKSIIISMYQILLILVYMNPMIYHLSLCNKP